MSKITLIGMYNYLKSSGDDLFLNMALPTGIDKESVINNILMRGGEFEVLYSEPYFLRDSIITWSKKWYWTFNKWLEAINVEYNPIENYDRIESWSDTEHSKSERDVSFNGSDTEEMLHTNDVTQSNDNKRTDELTTRQTADSENNETITENKTSAFDDTDYSKKDLNTVNQNIDVKTTNTGTVSNNGMFKENEKTKDNKTSHNENKTDDDNITDITRTHEARIHGNIGVLTSQQMVQSSIDLAYFNLYDAIADIFLQEYIIPIY